MEITQPNRMDKFIVVLTKIVLSLLFAICIVGEIILSPVWIPMWFCDKIMDRIRLARYRCDKLVPPCEWESGVLSM